MTNYLFVFIRLILCYKTYIYLLFVHIWWWAARWFVSWFSEFLVKPCRAYLNDTMMARVHQDVFIFILVCCRLYRTSISFAFGQRCARPLRPASRRWYRSLAIAKKKKRWEVTTGGVLEYTSEEIRMTCIRFRLHNRWCSEMEWARAKRE